MESVIVVAPFSYDTEIRSRLVEMGPLAVGAGGVVVVDDGRSRVYVGRNDAVYDELGPERLGQVKARMSEPVFYSVDFSELALCRRVLEAIADDPALLVDNDHGLLLPGDEFVHILRSQPKWDWRTSPPDLSV